MSNTCNFTELYREFDSLNGPAIEFFGTLEENPESLGAKRRMRGPTRKRRIGGEMENVIPVKM